MRNILVIVLFLTVQVTLAQKNNIRNELDQVLNSYPEKPFNGVLSVQKGNKNLYKKLQGISDMESGKKLGWSDRFVIGSISKQFAGAIVLQEIDAGRLDPALPIRNYLPELPQQWADTVTTHHLITHLHGIRKLDEPTAFPVGTAYEYSQIGFELLGKITEKTSGKSFSDLSTELFARCGMKNTSHPEKDSTRVNSYTEASNGTLKPESGSLMHYVPAGAFISTAEDLLIWNEIFYSGRLFSKRAMDLLTTKHKGAVRNHPIFGKTEYGYGITVDTKDDILQYGQTGYAPGFVSMNFYYPEQDVSVVLLSNTVRDEADIVKTFYYHTSVLNIVRKHLKSL